jgi:hypothetical protein
MDIQRDSLKEAALLMTLAKTVPLKTAARPEWRRGFLGSSNLVVGPVLEIPCSASDHHM